MSKSVKSVVLNQEELVKLISKAYSNYNKSPKARITISYIETRLEALESFWEDFKDGHSKIAGAVDRPEKAEMSYFKDDFFEQGEEVYLEYKTKLKDDLKQLTATTSETTSLSNTPGPSCEVRLPQINLPRFSGKYEDWQTFHDMFLSLIHKNSNLSLVQKLHYLKSCLHGEAENVLKNLSTIDTNYMEAWSQLTKRYNNKRYNTNEILKKLFAQKHIINESATSIKQLLDTTTSCLKSLENLHINTSSWDVIINYLVVSKLDQESRKQWELQASKIQSDELPTWEQLQGFLESRFRTIEMLEGVKPSTSRPKIFHSSIQESRSSHKCTMCNDTHFLYQCKQFSKQTPMERKDFVQTNRLCFNCLAPNHSVKKCLLQTSCRRCGRRHHSLIHIEKDREEVQGTNIGADQKQPHTHIEEETKIITNFSKQLSPCNVLLATAVVNVKSVKGVTYVVRALIDQGSQASFVTEATVQLLGLKRTPINGCVVGVGNGHTVVRYYVSLLIESRHNPGKSISVNAYVLSSLTSLLPSKVVHSLDFLSLEKLPLADPEFTSPSKIDVLLGAEVYSEIIMSGMIKNPSRNLIPQNTILGWIISGKVTQKSTSENAVTTMHIRFDHDDSLKQFWEIENQPDDSAMKKLTEEEIKCEEIFNNTTMRDRDGRLIVKLPFNSEEPQCHQGQWIQIATRRLEYLEKKLLRNPKLYEEYRNVMKEYQILNHMNLVDEDQIDNTKAVYLPHHAVVRDEKDTTKVRVVFDASCKGVNGVSLNDTVLVGPKLQQDLPDLLTRWRSHRICITADLEKIYCQVKVNEEHVHYQRILWRNHPNEPIKHYQLLRLTFGTACAPYLAVKTVQKLAELEQYKFPIAAKITQSDFYVDDLMTGCETESEAVFIYEELKNLLSRGGFKFQKWRSNSNAFFKRIGEDQLQNQESITIKIDKTVKILGLTWNREDDTFEYVVNLPPLKTPITKRQMISDIARLFDPSGWIAPVIIVAKGFIQKLWLAGIDWDQNVPEPLLTEWTTYRHQLNVLCQFSLPRWLNTSQDVAAVELQGFCDASNVAYAAVVFLRIVTKDGDMHVNLLKSKTKVAPVKQVSIPRLELCGAVLLSKLLRHESQILNIPKENVHAWTDSSVVLAWLSSHPSKWKTFIGNRVSEILTIMDNNQWSHVRSEHNPADCASRGVKAEDFINLEIWKKGPSWLRKKDVKYGKAELNTTDLEAKEIKTKCLTAEVKENEDIFEIDRFSSMNRMLRVLSWCLRWRCTKHERRDMPDYITVKELEFTLCRCIKVTQSYQFSNEMDHIKSRGCVLKKSSLYTLNPIIDNNGILRVGGRIDKANLSYDNKQPILLPAKSHLTRLIISDAHEKTVHGGPQLMLNHLRSKYFIIRARGQVKKYYRNCVTCKRYSTSNKTQLMGQIPEVRLKPSKPFKSTGVDYASPINLRFSPGRGSKAYKGYICLYICMVTRAVHIEVVSDLTAKGFIASFRRFTSRRGRCQHLFSDNGTNFVGANKQLHEMFDSAKSQLPNEIAQLLTLENTTWHFIPPHAPNFGGLWEAGVRSVKTHLRKVIGDSTLTYEELTTVLSQVEACLNSRPISVLSDNPDDPLPLTPGHFSVGEPVLNISDQDYSNENVSGLDRWNLCQKMVSNFWNKWSKEYLINLSKRYKWNSKITEPDVHDIVVIREDNVPPAKWILGKIVKKHPGPDGLSRVVTVKCKHGTLKRPLSQICVLTK